MSLSALLCAGLFLMLPLGNTAQADCLAGMAATCDGIACPGKAFKAGQMIYNSDHGVLQVCLADNTWKALHKPVLPDPCTLSSTVGAACADGQTIYAGTWNGNRYYTTKADQTSGNTGRYGAFSILLGASAQSTTNGLLNTNTALAYIEANPQAGACNANPYNPPACSPNAHLLCRDLRNTLGGDWYLPATDEILYVLLANKDAIGGFSNTYYLSSTEKDADVVYARLFPAGTSLDNYKFNPYRVRCVRK